MLGITVGTMAVPTVMPTSIQVALALAFAVAFAQHVPPKMETCCANAIASSAARNLHASWYRLCCLAWQVAQLATAFAHHVPTKTGTSCAKAAQTQLAYCLASQS
jgi:hypothetical protein